MKNSTNNAIIVTLNEDTSEIIELANTLDYIILEVYYQKKETPDVKSYIGKGKTEEIKEFIEKSDEKIDLVIVDGELRPSQWFNLEKTFEIEVFDRIHLILNIFEKHADRKEAKLQVRLAQLNYERPYVRELIHRARAGEHPGLMAGGEYQVDDYYEMIKKQIKKIKEQLGNIRNQRELRRKYRHTGGFYLISLSGYTNAGKSSLLNLLSGEKVKVEGKLFSTLSTTTRKINNNNIPILLTDTVGFIQDLPPFIIDAFHSTIEEIEVADVVLLIADMSENDDIIFNKLTVSLKELTDIGVNSPIIIILNKIDEISGNMLDQKIKFLLNRGILDNQNYVPISVKNKENIDKLHDLIYMSLPQLTRFKIKLPINSDSQSLISWIYDKTNVIDIDYGDYISLEIECNVKIKDKIISMSNKIKNKIEK
jgi:GTP-binding protein HflX